MINLTEVRNEVDALLDRPSTDAEWNFAVNQGLLRQRLTNEITSHGLAEKLRQMREAFSPPPEPATRERPAGSPDRIKAISEAVAQDAESDAAVVAFRDAHLKRGLLEPAAVENWIQKQAKRDGRRTQFVTVPVPPGLSLRLDTTQRAIVPSRPIKIPKDAPITHTNVRVLAYAAEGARCVKSIPVAADGVLDQLRAISEQLARRYTWMPAKATTFILTGYMPLVSPLRLEVRSKHIPALSRLVLTVDPAISPRELAEHYRRARQQFVGKRHRSMSEKHTTLVTFMNTRPAKETYARSMVAWNRKYPKWKYKAVSNFGRDVKTARKRLLGSGMTYLDVLNGISGGEK